MPPAPVKAVVLDLSDLLLPQPVVASIKIPQQTLSSARVSEEACRMISARYSLNVADVADILLARVRVQAEGESTREDEHEQLIDSLQSLKANTKDGDGIRLCGMLNISKPEYTSIQDTIPGWAPFDYVFLSCQVGMRKSDLCFYQHVLRELGLSKAPEEVLFLETDAENVLPARSIGTRVFLHTSIDATLLSLQNLLCDPMARVKEFLRVNAKRLHSVTSTDVAIWDNFKQLLVLEAMGIDETMSELVYLEEQPRKTPLTTRPYPDDLDTTAVALTVLEPPDAAVVHSVLDKMASHHGRGHEPHNTLSWVRDVLQHRAYLNGTRYYATPEAFLYFLARLLESTIAERVGLPGDALALAMRLLAARYVGITDAADDERLHEMQCKDGGWEVGWVYRYGKTDVRIGKRGLATALAVKALGLSLLNC
ncbi:hypothetical protein BDW75DRAFT_229624 [Aspergillus navahoensis]